MNGSAALANSNAQLARHAAAAILREPRFHSPSVPRPLHRFLEALGRAFRGLERGFVNAINAVGRVIPGGTVAVYVLLAMIVIAAVAVLVRRHSRRQTIAAAVRGLDGSAVRERPEELERQAQDAERDGRFADAVRLRFRAGLAHLAERGVVRTVRSTPTAELARLVDSPDFDVLADRFDEIAYGGLPAAADDAQDARSRWSAVLSGGARR